MFDELQIVDKTMDHLARVHAAQNDEYYSKDLLKLKLVIWVY
jgi:hypothetical protein